MKDSNPQISQLEDLLNQKSVQSELALMIVSLVKHGVTKNNIKSLIQKYVKINEEIDPAYTDELDDIIAAMEGYCSVGYMLHPHKLKEPTEK